MQAQVHDMKRPLSLPTHNYDRMREALNDDEDVKMDRNAWKVNAMRKGESIGWELWHKATDDYFRQVPSGWDAFKPHLGTIADFRVCRVTTTWVSQTTWLREKC